MILATTSNIEGRNIKEYRGIIFGEAVVGIDFVRDFGASITNFFGGRSKEYEEEIVNARADAVNEMINHAKKIGANAVIGIKVDVESIAMGNDRSSMIIVTATGTAVVLE